MVLREIPDGIANNAAYDHFFNDFNKLAGSHIPTEEKPLPKLSSVLPIKHPSSNELSKVLKKNSPSENQGIRDEPLVRCVDKQAELINMLPSDLSSTGKI